MAVLPTVHGTGVALYPLSRRVEFNTSVAKFINAREQRFKRSAPLARFELRYTGLSATDRNTLATFYASTKGAFDSTWSFALPTSTLGSVPTVGNPGFYTSLTFEDDAFQSVEGALPNRYDVTLRFRQTIKGGAIAGSGTNYPTLSTGSTSQRPYTQIIRYRTTKNNSPTGMAYAYSWFGAGLASPFPTRGLYAWKLEYPAISDADAATLEAFFIAMNGRWTSFSFTDPDNSTTNTEVRFEQDSLEVRAVGPNQNACTVLLAEHNLNF